LLESRCSLGPRVLWTSSATSHPQFYDPVDWQFVKSKHSYESSKYHTDLFATHLDRCSNQTTPDSKQIRHFIVDPGVVNTNIASSLLNFYTSIAFIFISYLVCFEQNHFLSFTDVCWIIQSRLLGLSCYTITPYKAAVSAVQLSFIPLSVIPSFATFSSMDSGKQNTARTSESSQNSRPLRFCSQSNRWGKDRVGVDLLKGWDDNEDSSRKLLDQCEVLYQSLREAHGKTSVKGNK
jgi:3-keto steroid reductase